MAEAAALNPNASAAPRRFGWVALGYAVVVLIWGTTWYVIRLQLNGTAPHAAAALRMGGAAAIFFAIALFGGTSLRVAPAHWRLLIVQGMCFYGLNYLAVYTGSQYLSSGVVAVVFSVSVPFNLLVEWLWYRITPKPALVAASLIGMAGIALVFRSELGRMTPDPHAAWGLLLVICAALVVAVGNVLGMRLAAGEVGPVRVNAYGMLIGALVLALWGLGSGTPWIVKPNTEWLAGYAYLVLIGSVLAFWIYMRILPLIGAVAGAYVVVLAPVVALVISALMEGLPLRPPMLLGVALLLAGNALVLQQRRRRVACQTAPIATR
jgi:drug/metabolite transporter (DMT)-like permease